MIKLTPNIAVRLFTPSPSDILLHEIENPYKDVQKQRSGQPNSQLLRYTLC